jgi:hypothetical protein
MGPFRDALDLPTRRSLQMFLNSHPPTSCSQPNANYSLFSFLESLGMNGWILPPSCIDSPKEDIYNNLIELGNSLIQLGYGGKKQERAKFLTEFAYSPVSSVRSQPSENADENRTDRSLPEPLGIFAFLKEQDELNNELNSVTPSSKLILDPKEFRFFGLSPPHPQSEPKSKFEYHESENGSLSPSIDSKESPPKVYQFNDSIQSLDIKILAEPIISGPHFPSPTLSIEENGEETEKVRKKSKQKKEKRKHNFFPSQSFRQGSKPKVQSSNDRVNNSPDCENAITRTTSMSESTITPIIEMTKKNLQSPTIAKAQSPLRRSTKISRVNSGKSTSILHSSEKMEEISLTKKSISLKIAIVPFEELTTKERLTLAAPSFDVQIVEKCLTYHIIEVFFSFIL